MRWDIPIISSQNEERDGIHQGQGKAITQVNQIISADDQIDKIIAEFPGLVGFVPGTTRVKPIDLAFCGEVKPIRQSPWRRSKAENDIFGRICIAGRFPDATRVGPH